jgi:hypothetical protein
MFVIATYGKGRNMFSITHHAQARLQQRGIPSTVIENLLDFGRQAHDHRGSTIVYFDHRARRSLQRQLPLECFRRLEPHLDAYAVLGSDGIVVTVGHRTQRINRS